MCFSGVVRSDGDFMYDVAYTGAGFATVAACRFVCTR